MAERDWDYRRDPERGGSRDTEGHASAFRGDNSAGRGGEVRSGSGGGPRGSEAPARSRDRWSGDDRYGQQGGASTYVGPAGTGWASETAYGPRGSGDRGGADFEDRDHGARDAEFGSRERGSREWGGHGSYGLDYRAEPRGDDRGTFGSMDREYRGADRSEAWRRSRGHGEGAGGSSGGSGGGEWGNQGFGVAPHLLLGGRRAEEGERRNRGPKGWQRSDERIHEDVCERLMGESGVDPSDVSVQVSAGVVTLTGTVPSRQMKYHIEELADRCPGVTDIDNRIRVDRGEGVLRGSSPARSGSGRGSLLGRLFGFSTGTTVSAVMTRDPQVVSPDESLMRVAQMMKEHDVGSIPVCNGRRLVGMITDRDIVIRSVADGKQADSAKVSEAMTSKVHWCYDDENIDQVLEKMGSLQVRRIPVVDRSKQLVGIVALGDLSHEDAGDLQDTLQEISQSPVKP